MGLFTFGAWGYSVTRPLKVGPLPVYTTSAEVARTDILQDVPAPHVMEMPAVTIKGRAQAKTTAKPAVEAAPAQRDITQMRCAEWRPLEQGGASVRECN